MKEYIYKNNKIIIITVVVALLVGVTIYYGGIQKAGLNILQRERTINEAPIPRVLEKASAVDGRFVVATGEQIPLVSNKRVIIEGGKTLKDGYFIAEPVAILWAVDAKLVYVRSLGTVNVDGVSSGWEVAFGSKAKKKGYVISVVGGVVMGKNEVDSKSSGYALPTNWYDSGEAIKTISSLPQFVNATISGLNFYYNEDGKRWGYAVSSSLGTVSIPVR